MLSAFHMEKAVSLAVLQLDQAAPEGGIVSGRKQERGDDPGVGMSLAHIEHRAEYAHSLLELSHVIREMPMDRKSFIDILPLKPAKLRGVDCDLPVKPFCFNRTAVTWGVVARYL